MHFWIELKNVNEFNSKYKLINMSFDAIKVNKFQLPKYGGPFFYSKK